ncbi:hypothetical protein [Chromobacterium phragmitis]|uniref:Uncharacterized protein n=1 Tax=Chromobacterium phragmitis TaxID=2202141 RepID=A0ABV0IXJ3_9NEIS
MRQEIMRQYNKAVMLALLAGLACQSAAGDGVRFGRVPVKDADVVALTNKRWDKRVYLRENGKQYDLFAAYENYDIETIIRRGRYLALFLFSYGIAEDMEEGKRYHEVPHCMFVERRTGCVLGEGSQFTCDGEWVQAAVWQPRDREAWNMRALRKQVLAGTDKEGAENRRRCGMR